MSQINVSNLTFAYEGSYTEVFHDTSFVLDTDWKLGFIGRNGKGKTTFLKLLLGEYEYRGRITARVNFRYFPFAVADPAQLSLQVLEDLGRGFEYWQLQRELNLLGVNEEVLYQPFETLSNGEQTKLLLAALFLGEDLFLLIDEPTNHLDKPGREIVARYLNRKQGFILVSHDRKFLDACIDHVLSINRQSIQVEQGNYSSFAANKQARDDFELAQNAKLQGEIRQLTQAARRTEKWSDDVEKTKIGSRIAGLRPDRGAIGHKAAKMMKRSKAIESRIDRSLEEKKGLLADLDDQEPLKMFPAAFHSTRLLSLDDVQIYYGERTITKRLNLVVSRGERICLAGANGTGKSSILKLLLGEAVPHHGTVQVAPGLKVSYVSQSTAQLRGSLTEYARQYGVDKTLLMTLLRKLDLPRESLETDIGGYSEGQKKKVLLARSLCEQAHLYIWDEPLNYIDILSREQIETVILASQPTLLFVEHDERFCDKIATRTIPL